MEYCCTCTTTLLPPSPSPSPEPSLPDNRRVECCSRVICGKCIHHNNRFADYCPYCQVSNVPSTLPQGLKDPPLYTAVPRSGARTVSQAGPPPPPYASDPTAEFVAGAGDGRRQEVEEVQEEELDEKEQLRRQEETENREWTGEGEGDEETTKRKKMVAAPNSGERDEEKAAGAGDDDAAEDTLHFVNHDHDTVQSLSLRYGVPAAALRRANNITSDHLLLARRTVIIPGEFYKAGVSLSPRPIGGEEEEQRKGRIRRFMTTCKVADYDVALLYLEQAGYDVEMAAEAYFDDETWEKAHPNHNRSNMNGPASSGTSNGKDATSKKPSLWSRRFRK